MTACLRPGDRVHLTTGAADMNSKELSAYSDSIKAHYAAQGVQVVLVTAQQGSRAPDVVVAVFRGGTEEITTEEEEQSHV